MDLNGLKVFRALVGKMNHAAERQALLAQNVANSDTPGFRPKDLKPFTFDQAMRQAGGVQPVQMSATAGKHLAPRAQGGTDFKQVTRSGAEVLPNGNAINLEQELTKLSQNSSEQVMVVNMYRRVVSMLRMAIGRSGGG